jgi:hypothetical protein
MLRLDELRFKDFKEPDDAKEPSLVKLPSSSFCCPRDSNEGLRDKRFNVAELKHIKFVGRVLITFRKRWFRIYRFADV